MRVLPKLGQEIVGQIEEAWKLPQEDWARKRLLVVRLIAQHEHTVAEIMKIAAVCRQTVFTYRDKVLTEGVKGLLKRDWNGARKPAVRGAVAEEFLESLGEGKFRQARDAQTWIKKRTKNTASLKKAAPYLKLSIRPREKILIPPTCTPDVNEMHFA
jgi:hypothetical protein